jgi:hypothetical protein
MAGLRIVVAARNRADQPTMNMLRPPEKARLGPAHPRDARIAGRVHRRDEGRNRLTGVRR